MFDLFSGLDAWVGISLVLALAFVLTFEFINGFHDTANAVATVISSSVCCSAASAWPTPSFTCCRWSC